MLNLANFLTNARTPASGPTSTPARQGAVPADGAPSGLNFAAAMQQQRAQQALGLSQGLGAPAPQAWPANLPARPQPAGSASPGSGSAGAERKNTSGQAAAAGTAAAGPSGSPNSVPASGANADTSAPTQPKPTGPSTPAESTSAPAAAAASDAASGGTVDTEARAQPASAEAAGERPDPRAAARLAARRAGLQAARDAGTAPGAAARARLNEGDAASTASRARTSSATATAADQATTGTPGPIDPTVWLAQALTWQPSGPTGQPEGESPEGLATGTAPGHSGGGLSGPPGSGLVLALPGAAQPATQSTHAFDRSLRGAATAASAADSRGAGDGRIDLDLQAAAAAAPQGATAARPQAAPLQARTGRLDEAPLPDGQASAQRADQVSLDSLGSLGTGLPASAAQAAGLPRDKPEATPPSANAPVALPTGMAVASGAGFAGTGQGRGGQNFVEGPDARATATAAAEPLGGTAPPAFALPTPGATPTGSNAATAAARAEASIPVPVQDPGFGMALGSQVALLVKDGITEARLQLNPAELGPISVQISLDGSSAQVSFQADMAATRSALESSMPALASALQDAGLTLSGGGVFQQPHPGQGQGQGQNPGQPAPDQAQGGRQGSLREGLAGAGSGPSDRPVPRQARGLVDLVA